MHLTTEQRHTENAERDVTGVQRCGVVADFAFVHPLKAKTGSEDGQRKVPIDKFSGVPTEAFLYFRHCVTE